MTQIKKIISYKVMVGNNVIAVQKTKTAAKKYVKPGARIVKQEHYLVGGLYNTDTKRKAINMAKRLKTANKIMKKHGF